MMMIEMKLGKNNYCWMLILVAIILMVFHKKMVKLGVGVFGHKRWLMLIIG